MNSNPAVPVTRISARSSVCPKHRKLTARGRMAVLAGLLGFIALQLAMSVLMDTRWPDLRDPEYGLKLHRLRAQQAANPARPLYVLLGSSRSAMSIQPSVLFPDAAERSQTPLVINCGIMGGGPIGEWMCLRRLLSDGVRPQQVFVEIFPALLHQQPVWNEFCWLNINKLSGRDVATLRPYSDAPASLTWQWLHSRFTPWYTHRFSIMSRVAPQWLPWNCRQDAWQGMDDFGFLPYGRTSVDDATRLRGIEVAHREYGPAMDGFEITARPKQALQQILELCQEKQIAVALVLMPEGTIFQSWYPADSRRQIDEYLRGLSQRYHAPVIDTRNWMPDDAFVDSHHLLPPAATAFSRRLGREALQPLAAGTLPQDGVLLSGTEVAAQGPFRTVSRPRGLRPAR